MHITTQPYRGSSLGGGSGRDPFIDVYQSYTTNLFPRGMSNALLWAERVVMKDGVYISAIRKIVSYFITDIQVEGDISEDQKKDYTEFLVDGLGIKSHLFHLGMDYFVYANGFPSFVVPIRRTLTCPTPGCPSKRVPMQQVAENPVYDFRWKSNTKEFLATCPWCKKRGAFFHHDENSDRMEDVQIVMRNPHEISIVHDTHSGQSEYFWRIPEDYKKEITERPNQRDQVRRTFQLERSPWPVVEAVCNKQHLLFDPGFLHHVKDRTISGVLNKGWGLPRALSSFDHAFYVQALRRMNTTLAIDYVVPTRVVCPMPKAGTGSVDPVMDTHLGGLNQHFANLVESHRRDPAGWHFFPVPLQYQLLGGEAKQLAPHELIDLGTRDFLAAIEIPEELYRGSVTTQAAPMAARLLESNHSHFLHHMNKFLDWVADRMATTMSWDRVKIRLTRPSVFDDVNLRLARLQLAGQGMVSQSAGLDAIDLDFRDQQNIMVAEQQYAANLAAESEETMGKAQLGTAMAQGQLDPAAQQAMAMQEQGQGGGQGGAAAPAGDPMMQGTDPVAEVLNMLPPGQIEELSPQEIRGLAQEAAQKIFYMSEAQKDSALIQLKKISPDFHLYVKEEHSALRRQAERNGVAMAQQAGQA